MHVGRQPLFAVQLIQRRNELAARQIAEAPKMTMVCMGSSLSVVPLSVEMKGQTRLPSVYVLQRRRTTDNGQIKIASP